ncbi:hypothetical protein CBS147339_4945 [Penicillium roqueforti]|uniref:Splicing factor PWI n=1 Tax=Penicillium roqueforti (strain FM164) TaxID=1365484 RepID=W6QJP3_PENRF|nr:hypothetical protein CBS147339_4945 [Penicillium roqueforti]KAI3103524.1 hypothetical protein CBS147338_2053 [Penicillium roqueforti]KAI3186770.1 hypothetical protein DTO032C6_4260 [Penicillium roqueforti]CDM34434.1 Splicing factor PWI [Penicillium roqueforti FM164]
MQFTDAEAADVKKWVVKKLEDISDADSDVLADYVLALVRSDAPAEEIKKISVENLEDFLREHTQPFVTELFTTFGPKQPAPPTPAPAPQPQRQPQPAAQIPLSQPPENAPSGPRATVTPGSANRKRTFNEGFQGEPDHDDSGFQNRAIKTARRGGRGGSRGDFMGGQHMQAGQQYPPQQAGQLFPLQQQGQQFPSQQQGQQFPPHQQGQQFPPQQPGGFPMMPGFPPFDPNDPMAAMMAMQSMQGMGFPPMPGMLMPGMPGPPGQPGADQIPKSNQRCPFYDTQGICYLGNTCPYQHGEGVSKDDEYDPKTAGTHAQRGGAPSRGDRGRGRGRGGFSGRGRGRSDFSSAGPNEDQSVTTIVVEQIPDDKFNEDSVREFFSEFGKITEVSLQPYKKVALVKYETFPEAKAAWSSPKVIFDNRFVKVYWYKPNRDETHDSAQPEAPAFNKEEFEKQQQEAQRAHEEKMKKRQETEAAKQALERQRDELIKKQQEERARLMQRLGGTTDTNGATGGGDAMATEPPADENISAETKQLRAQLAALEAEAKSLGLDPAADPSARGGYRGRGGFRGRGTYRGRGAYDPNFRGGYRGRGGFAARGRGGVLRLDNRPRRVAVSGVELNSDKDEALRQHLMGVGEYESIEAHPDQPNSVVVAFKERFQAEKLMFSPWNIPSVGEVQLTWVPNPPVVLPTAGSSTEFKGGIGQDEPEDTVMSSSSVANSAPARDMDYDVAEDDSWGA